MLKKIISKLQRIIYQSNSLKLSFSQAGEDLIVSFIFNILIKQKEVVYMDIGAHHPTYMSNTYLLYLNGNHGICIEPDPSLYKNIKQKRERDICLNVGIGVNESEKVPFYISKHKELSTFSSTQAENISDYSKIDEIINVDVVTINHTIEKYLNDKSPDFISIDIEGLDYEVLKSFNFSKYRPAVFCIETIDNATLKKDENILKIMAENNYLVYADTFINTIFIDSVHLKRN